IAHAAAQVGAVAGGLLVESKDVAVGELVVAFGPATYLRKSWSERPRNHVLRPADEDRPIAHPRKALDLLDHLGVVIGGEERVTLAQAGHRHPSDDVRQPYIRRGLQLRVLVQE